MNPTSSRPKSHQIGQGDAEDEEAIPGGDAKIIPKVSIQSTYIVECRVSILGITIMIWESIPYNGT